MALIWEMIQVVYVVHVCSFMTLVFLGFPRDTGRDREVPPHRPRISRKPGRDRVVSEPRLEYLGTWESAYASHDNMV